MILEIAQWTNAEIDLKRKEKEAKKERVQKRPLLLAKSLFQMNQCVIYCHNVLSKNEKTLYRKEFMKTLRTELTSAWMEKKVGSSDLEAILAPKYKELLPEKTMDNDQERKEEKPVKRKKYSQFPYLQTHNGPPQTRSAKLRKQQKQNDQSSREESPSGSSSDNKGGWSSGSSKPAWAASLPPGLSVEPVYTKKACHGCGRNDVPSLLVRCEPCGMHWHTGCGERGRCTNCRAPLPDPAHCTNASSPPDTNELFRDKLKERKRLQEKNIELCLELRKLEARASTLKENLDDHHAERRLLLADQIKTQRNLQKLLNFIRQFKDTSVSMHSTSVSEASSEVSKSNDE
ncbi:hypothetical protein EVAR_2440_1 [Eumeta japonica]|uniref:Uncharacterized protein n=1 Tax=Eumeta variegata TaxID=151549 RepID=A0A4C1SP13_EUMVA|nr:hypothetical protein EVAR_2440_1 [Eumeta japonica]